jgi:UDP-2-acetamido-2-deoxy-ribo-hexuluronate aminotransferase
VNLAAGIYTEQLKEIVKTPIVPEGYLSSWAQYTIQLKDEKERNGLQEYLKSKGIPSMIYYPIPMHCQRAFDELKLYQECLVTEKLCKTVLALPMHPYLNSKEQGAVINEIQKFLKGV